MEAILRNWKTTGFAILALVVTFAPIPTSFPKIQLLGLVVAAGFFFAGDGSAKPHGKP